MNKKVAIERCPSYEGETVYKALKKAVELAGGIAVTGKTVLLKPNILLDAAPEKAICTHPIFLEAAIKLVREMGASRILVGDSPGLQMPGFTGKISGLGEAARKNGAEWVDFTKEKIDLPCEGGKVMKKFTVTRSAREADIVICLPKLKAHQLMYFTGAMKNIFGLIPSAAKSPFHARFSGRKSFAAMIVDLNLAVKPAYAFMDAVIGMEGPGPAAGSPRHIGLIIASSNLLALDAAACSVIGYPAGEIPVNKEALSRGFWLSDFEEIEYPGLRPEEVKVPDFEKIPFKKSDFQFIDFLLPRPLRRLKDSFAPLPQIRHDTCVRCGDCRRICASRAIDCIEEKMIIDYHRCIRCFCCHEICPLKAIEVSKRKARD